MECYKIENMSFAYPGNEGCAVENINLTIKKGEFVTVCGKSGCGKTTLLRLMKPSVAPSGKQEGKIFFEQKLISELDKRTQACEIGFVMQDPDSQIVSDTVWHELAFGMESLGFSNSEIRTRVSEMASFFGIQSWFHEKVSELSGGQKQLLNLASVMAMQPSVLILDEPSSQLDPIAAQEFLRTLEKINRELGTTVVLSEHRLEDAFAVSNRVVVMDKGKIIADGVPEEMGRLLKNHPMYMALPTPLRVGAAMNAQPCPVTVRDGRRWLEQFAVTNTLRNDLIPKDKEVSATDVALELKDVWFRYKKELPDVVCGANIKIQKGEIFALVGGNGAGKTTVLSLIAGLYTPHRGKIFINGESADKVKNRCGGIIGMLPQNPQMLFVQKSVCLELADMLSETEDKEKIIAGIAKLCDIEQLLDRNPADLSGGEQQRAALAKVLLLDSQILIFDEPTKGMDAEFKVMLAGIMKKLAEKGKTIIMVSHDIEFCCEYANRCTLMFDGQLSSAQTPRRFFSGNSFYTTAASRMARTALPEAVLAEDIIIACGGNVGNEIPGNVDVPYEIKSEKPENKVVEKKRISPARIGTGLAFGLLFILACVFQKTGMGGFDSIILQCATIATLFGFLVCFMPGGSKDRDIVKNVRKHKISRKTIISALVVFVTIPLTIRMGITVFGDRKYYFISLLMILQIMLPFFIAFEGKKPEAREIIIISVICALAVAGRFAFFMLPQFKPTLAIIILAGVCFGGEAGFLAGAVAAFVSNFFFGQGPWTPWQMFATGITGFLAGVIFERGFLPHTKAVLCIFGAIATVVLYGGISNASSLILWQTDITKEMIISTYAMGLPFDILHAASTVFFLYFISEPVIDKLERVKIKYGFK